QIEQVKKLLVRARKSKNKEAVQRLEYRLARLKSLQASPRENSNPQLTLTPEKFVEEAYLRTLSRFPDDEERRIALAAFKDAESPATGARELMWVLLNTKEFVVNH